MAPQRNGWLGAKVSADKGIGISFGVIIERGKKKLPSSLASLLGLPE
jgi:hypothetical protein